MSDAKWLQLVFNLLSSFDCLKFVEVELEVSNLTRLSQLSEGDLHRSEKFFFLLEVGLLLLFDFNFDDCLEFTHELLS